MTFFFYGVDGDKGKHIYTNPFNVILCLTVVPITSLFISYNILYLGKCKNTYYVVCPFTKSKCINIDKVRNKDICGDFVDLNRSHEKIFKFCLDRLILLTQPLFLFIFFETFSRNGYERRTTKMETFSEICCDGVCFISVFSDCDLYVLDSILPFFSVTNNFSFKYVKG